MQFIGIDAHKDTLAAAVIDEHGRQPDVQTFANEPSGYCQLIAWATRWSASRIGIEGSVRTRVARQRLARLEALCSEIDHVTCELRSLIGSFEVVLTGIIGVAELPGTRERSHARRPPRAGCR